MMQKRKTVWGFPFLLPRGGGFLFTGLVAIMGGLGIASNSVIDHQITASKGKSRLPTSYPEDNGCLRAF